MIRFVCFFLFFLFNFSLFAQKKTVFTRQDSLRGTLSTVRSCYDVGFYKLSVRVVPEKEFISGSTTIVYKVVADFKEIQIDLFANMAIEKIMHRNKKLKFRREGNATFVQFKDLQKVGKIDSIQVFFSGNPRKAVNPPWDGGFSWKKDLEGNTWIGVSCEGIGASLWWANKDHLSDEPDSMQIACEVPQDLMCVSNGTLRKTEPLPDNFQRFTWFVHYPINNYNVTLNIAKYAHFSDKYISFDGDTLALDYYVLPYNLEKARKHFEQVKPMLACYEKYFGKYPFWKDGYALVETPYWGMEHQGAIAYGNNYERNLIVPAFPFDYIIIHETGHEYWGNSVSCKDYAEMWIHESFCTYAEALYVECIHGSKAKAEEYLMYQRRRIQNNEPMIAPLGVNAEAPQDIYFKGSWMLHTLRHVIDNDDLWFKIIKGLATDFKMKNVDTQDIIRYINQKTGTDYTYFFKQYLYKPKPPTFEYKFEQEGEKTNMLYRWQGVEADFQMPFHVDLGDKNYVRITPTTEWQKLTDVKQKDKVKIPIQWYYILVKSW
ncbi:MAG: M1 family metallopeptidase [Microscillaceae bacterium]|nr:M1 family metallopeptidase [Microscillaceae bacterium]MDW8461622.1 M1 family metallopeptidase [Cytophagales bacterium]